MPGRWSSTSAPGQISCTVGALDRRYGANRSGRRLTRALPEKDATEKERILAGMWDNLGRAVAELPHLAPICRADSERVEFVDCAVLVEILESDRSALLFGGHFLARTEA